MSLQASAKEIKEQIWKKFPIYHYSIFSIFIKNSFAESIIKNFRITSEESYYIYYEESSNLCELNDSFYKTHKVQATSEYPRKFLYEVANYSQLVTNYIEIIKIHKLWPIYAIFPIKFTIKGQIKKIGLNSKVVVKLLPEKM